MIRCGLVVVLLAWTLNCLGQDYTYDLNGNVSGDANKKIRSIHYNYLDLPDTIIFMDGRMIIYMYSASGSKLQQQVIDASGNALKKADYIRQLVYNNDSLRYILNENARFVPILVANSASPWEYQYELKDHLGNVRAMLTSRQDADNARATFESSSLETEQNQFQRYEDVRRINSTLFDHTRNGSSGFSQRLNGSANEKYGLAKSLSVMPGDVVNMDVFAKYVDPDASQWSPLFASLMTLITNGAAGTVVDGSGYANSGSTPIPFVGLNGTSNNTDAGPKAYLNWLIFDKNFTFQNGGYVKIDPLAKENGSDVTHDHLSKQVTIKEAGYVYVYLSNEEASPIDVFFDDFTVQLVKGPVIQQTDYDPFGLVLSESTREHSEPNNFLYGGKELQRDLDLNWYDYGARMYDPALGRWHVVDSKAEKYEHLSPYSYAMNNPVFFRDPDGRDVVPSKAFLKSPFGPIFRDLSRNNAEYREILKNYKGRKGTLTLDVGEDPESPGANAVTRSSLTPKPNSRQLYSKKNISPTLPYGSKEVTYQLTEIAMAAIIIHESIHSEMGADNEDDDPYHDKFNDHHEQFMKALKAYNDEHNLGYTDEQLEELSYVGSKQATRFNWYINKIAKAKGTTYDEEFDNYLNRIWTELYFTIKEEKEIQQQQQEEDRKADQK